MSIEAMKQAIEALNDAVAFREGGRQKAIDAITALRTAIQQATQPAEVTDDLVEKATVETFQKTGADLIPEVAATFARAILALRPQSAEKLVPMPHRHYSEALADDLIASGDVESVIASHSEKETPWPHN